MPGVVVVVVFPAGEDVGGVPSCSAGVDLHRVATGVGKANQYLRVLAIGPRPDCLGRVIRVRHQMLVGLAVEREGPHAAYATHSSHAEF
jgi:hypothetical protein